MVSIIPTPHQGYKVWFSSEVDQFMDKEKPQRPSPRQTASLTDPTSLQSLLPANYPVPPRPIQLRLPETRTSRKRKASDVEDLTMSNHPRSKSRREGDSRPETINPSETLITTSAYGEFTPVTMATSTYGFHSPQQVDRRGSAPATDPSYNYYTFGPVVPDSSPRQSVSSTPSVTSTTSGPMVPNPVYQPPMTYSNIYYQTQPPSQIYTPVIPSNPQYDPQPVSRSGVDPSMSYSQQPNPATATSNQKPKPQCWDHGCNGREFSTFSNLLRHQRERSGTAPRSYCPRCGAEFTRSTARTNHLLNSKCKPRRSSSG